MNEHCFIWHKAIFLGTFLAIAINVSIAQEIKTEKEFYKDHAIEYNYYADELGFFEKYHGWQTDHYSIGKYNWDFKIKYDEGTPKQFSFEGRLPWEGQYFNVKSKGIYDSNGISSFYSNFEVNLAKRHLQVELIQSQSGPRLYFDSHISDQSIQNITESTYGFYTNDNYFIVQKYNGPHEANKVGVKSFILFGSTIYRFANLSDLEAFLNLECSSIEEMEQSGFNYKNLSADYQIILDKGQVSEDWWMMGAFAQWSEDDLVSGFVNTSGKYGQIPFKCWSTKFGTKATYNFIGFQYLERMRGKNIKTFFDVFREGKVQNEKQKTIEFLTDEQYEKYKSRLEYDAKVGRHGVRKADGSYLYVPNNIEKNITKTPAEIQKDKEITVSSNRMHKHYELLFRVYQTARSLQDSILDFPDLEDALMEE